MGTLRASSPGPLTAAAHWGCERAKLRVCSFLQGFLGVLKTCGKTQNRHVLCIIPPALLLWDFEMGRWARRKAGRGSQGSLEGAQNQEGGERARAAVLDPMKMLPCSFSSYRHRPPATLWTMGGHQPPSPSPAVGCSPTTPPHREDDQGSQLLGWHIPDPSQAPAGLREGLVLGLEPRCC